MHKNYSSTLTIAFAVFQILSLIMSNRMYDGSIFRVGDEVKIEKFVDSLLAEKHIPFAFPNTGRGRGRYD